MCLSLGISPQDLSLDPTDKDLHSGDQLNMHSMKEQKQSLISRDTLTTSHLGSKQVSQNSPSLSVRTPDHRMRGESLRFSSATGESDAILSQHGFLHLIFPKRKRKQKVKSYLFWSLGNIMVGAYISVLILLTRGKYDMECVHEEIWWLSVYLVLHMLHLIRKWLLAYFWGTASDPSLC